MVPMTYRVDTESNDPTNEGDSHKCPFPQCKHSYLTPRNLKIPLRHIRGGGDDDVHPVGHPEWQWLDEMGFLKLHTRPKAMSEADREKR